MRPSGVGRQSSTEGDPTAVSFGGKPSSELLPATLAYECDAHRRRSPSISTSFLIGDVFFNRLRRSVTRSTIKITPSPH